MGKRIDMTKITFTDKEMTFINLLAKGRHFEKDIVNPDRDLKRWNNTQHEADLLGVMGEYAVAKYLRIPFDTSINLSGDGGHTDMYIGEWTIQVKTTKYTTGKLVFNTKEELKALIYILVICDQCNGVAKIIGYISKPQALKVIYVDDLGHGSRFCIDQETLKPIAHLSFLCNEHYFIKNKTQ